MKGYVRVPSPIYEALRDIKLELEREYRSDGPSLQNIANAAFEKFLADWQDPEVQAKLTADLIQRRKVTRKRQGPHAKSPDTQTHSMETNLT